MEKEIRFGKTLCSLRADDSSATLLILGTSLPVILADVINDAEDVTVDEVSVVDSGGCLIRMSHSLPKGDLLDHICESISRVYDVDVNVSYARSQSSV